MNIPKIPEGEYRFCLIMLPHDQAESVFPRSLKVNTDSA